MAKWIKLIIALSLDVSAPAKLSSFESRVTSGNIGPVFFFSSLFFSVSLNPVVILAMDRITEDRRFAPPHLISQR